MPDDARFCSYCGKPLIQRLTETPKGFRRRETCDHSCAARLGHQREMEKVARAHNLSAAGIAEHRESGLCLCGQPRKKVKGRVRRTCGARACWARASVNLRYREREEDYVPHWPQLTGEVIADFSAHNIAAPDGGARKIVVDDLRQSYTGCSAAYTAGVA